MKIFFFIASAPTRLYQTNPEALFTNFYIFLKEPGGSAADIGSQFQPP